MSRHPDAHLVESEAARLSNLTVADAKRELGHRIALAFQMVGYNVNPTFVDREDFKAALDFNARLVSALRDRRVRLWG